MTDEQAVVFHQAGTGPGTWAMGSLFEHLVGPAATGGRLGVSLVVQPPGIATPLHRHTRESEAFFVLEGRIEYRAGEETYELTAGSFLHLPAGIPHAFRIRGDAPARFLGLTVPGGLMGLYDEVGIPAREMRLPGDDGLPMAEEIARWNEVGSRYGLEVVGPPIPA
ncbi:cupin domain-containing protein [Nocardioides mesophilus]|uniref:Cupin domain-containing protein n=1 Tax=Nocardioides mesophilus TaxID=433659 RepID=A0A7G9RAC4_9ACTN|nr:cupin domain-containing protein [Nocardioides mesophilus]QNN52549.1 cupin domain-containing protein [Nocardioides mesophilus]